MIVVDDVHKKFGTVAALRGVSFEVERGEIIGLVGPNGAGKTTMLRLISGCLDPDRGRVVVAARRTRPPRGRRRGEFGVVSPPAVSPTNRRPSQALQQRVHPRDGGRVRGGI